jgi:hypothetical protein
MKFKAQGLVELGLILAFIAVIAVASFSPIGTKIKDSLAGMSPQKNMVVSNETLNTLTKSQANTDTVNKNINKLQSSSNIASKDAATFIKDTMSIASKVSTGKSSTLSEEEVALVAKSIKKNTVETSGSLASLIAVNVNTAALASDELSALNEANNLLKDTKIVINTAGTQLATSIDGLVASLSGIDASGFFKFDMSPVAAATTDINAVKSNFIISAKPANLNDNVVNSVLLAENILNSSSPLATAEIKAKAQKVLDDFKTSLKVQ